MKIIETVVAASVVVVLSAASATASHYDRTNNSSDSIFDNEDCFLTVHCDERYDRRHDQEAMTPRRSRESSEPTSTVPKFKGPESRWEGRRSASQRHEDL